MVIWQDISSKPVFPRKEWFLSRQKKSDDGVAKVIYISKDKKYRKVFNDLDWLARLVDKILRVTFRSKYLNLWDIRNHDPPGIESV